MKLILSQYVRTLRERDEFDRLLPDLLLSMGYVPISKPQTGVRQYGVDLAAVGLAEDGVRELLLLVIKRGDIGRNGWDSGPQSVRQSLNDAIDVYLKTHVEPAHESLRKRIVLVTTGDLKQEVQVNWDNYIKEYASRAVFSFWGGDQIAALIERYMLDEHIFRAEDRTDLRRSLALAGELDYDQRDLHRLFRRQLGLGNEGQLLEQSQRPHELVKALRAVNLSAQIFSGWSENDGNLKHALVAAERAMLWSWHRIHLEDADEKHYKEFAELWRGYNAVAHRYFAKLQAHLYVQDGLSGYCRENAEFSLVVFEQIGLIATFGLSQMFVAVDDPTRQTNLKSSAAAADGLAALLRNNPVSGSPRLDGNIIDITLGLLLLVSTGYTKQAGDWLWELARRADYTFKVKRNFPIGTDSIDDLVEATVHGDEELSTRLMKTSWLLPTLAGWSVILDRDDVYDLIARGTTTQYPEMCLQLWHPTQDIAKHLYYWSAQDHCGESEAPINLPGTSGEFRSRMKAVLASERHNSIASSPACAAGLPAIDLVASRHFRTPVAPFLWYQLLQDSESSSRAGASTVS